jgi:hypothetical protein
LPDLTYFIGRPFSALEVDEDSNVWTIILDGDGRITNKDESKEAPSHEALTGTTFVRPIFSELDTRLQFGVLDTVAYEIVLTPSAYTISDPSFGEEEEIYPQVPVAIEDSLPEDPSADRVVDGPEEVKIVGEDVEQEGTGAEEEKSGDEESTEEESGGDEEESSEEAS